MTGGYRLDLFSDDCDRRSEREDASCAGYGKSWAANLPTRPGYSKEFQTSSADTGDWRDGFGLQAQSLFTVWIVQAHTTKVWDLLLSLKTGRLGRGAVSRRAHPPTRTSSHGQRYAAPRIRPATSIGTDERLSIRYVWYDHGRTRVINNSSSFGEKSRGQEL